MSVYGNKLIRIPLKILSGCHSVAYKMSHPRRQMIVVLLMHIFILCDNYFHKKIHLSIIIFMKTCILLF